MSVTIDPNLVIQGGAVGILAIFGVCAYRLADKFLSNVTEQLRCIQKSMDNLSNKISELKGRMP